jgi:ribosomal protein S27AE
LEHFLSDTDFVMSGRRGAISDDKWLVNNYDPEFAGIVIKYLRCDDERVRRETVMLLGEVRERAALDEVRRMRTEDKEKVRMACLGYLASVQEADTAVPDLMDILEHKRGKEFSAAAVRMRAVARAEDVPRLRRIYGQVEDGMRSEIREVLDAVVKRNPEMAPKRDLILSVPVYPDEAAFDRFLTKSTDYLDVRYRRSVLPLSVMGRETYNNVARAMRSMRIRLYNEYDNLQLYDMDKKDRSEELAAMIAWASADLAKKKVDGDSHGKDDHRCPRCGELMVSYKGLWSCTRCGSPE